MALGRPLVAIDLPGHGHSDGPGPRPEGQLSPHGNAEDVAVVVRALAPDAQAVVGMSLGGITTIALTAVAPDLVRNVVLVDVTPGVNREKARQITDFVNGPPSFPDFDELLARTMQFNPTRSESSLRRGILHNAVQREDGSWVWRWARWREDAAGAPRQEGTGPDASPQVPMFGGLWDVVERIPVPVMLARGMLSQSVISDEDEAELRRRLPDAKVVHFDHAGHSIQGDMPVELAQAIESFVFS
jgi:pimeloyl-ACP methyl ester carboxylesterase